MFDRFLIWLDDRTALPALGHKIRNWSVPPSAWYLRFLPAIILFTFLLQVITGVVLAAFYCSSTQTAWESLFHLQFNLPGGWLIRGIHHFAAQLLLVWLGLYLLILIFTRRYRSPREFVFWTAFLLFLFTLGLLFSGGLLSWTHASTTAALVQLRFLQMLPFLGEPLLRIICGDNGFSTLTLPRFLVLHILVFGGGFFTLLILWRIVDYKSSAIQAGINAAKSTQPLPPIPLFSNEILKYALASLFVMGIVLLLIYRMPILNIVRPDLFSVNDNLPREAALGVVLGAPADAAGSYDTVRPDWHFRALYHLTHLKIKDQTGTEIDLFSGSNKLIPIFVIPGSLVIYMLLLPVIGRLFVGHCLNVLLVFVLFLSFGYLTLASYYRDYFDPSMQMFRDSQSASVRQAERAAELCLSAGIPQTGALTLMQTDPYLQGPVLFKQHCAVCHSFEPMNGEPVHSDFQPIPCAAPVAPNLYQPLRKEWIAGILDMKRVRSSEYFGNTKFASGAMVGFVRGRLQEIVSNFASRDEFDQELDKLVDFLAAEAKRDALRTASEPVSAEQYNLFSVFSCTECHWTYHPTAKPRIQAPDLRGYLSRNWLLSMIANPESTRFYGPLSGQNKGNDAMPAFYLNERDAVMSRTEIEILTDWLRGHWHRFQKVSKIEEAMQPVE